MKVTTNGLAVVIAILFVGYFYLVMEISSVKSNSRDAIDDLKGEVNILTTRLDNNDIYTPGIFRALRHVIHEQQLQIYKLAHPVGSGNLFVTVGGELKRLLILEHYDNGRFLANLNDKFVMFKFEDIDTAVVDKQGDK